MIPAELMNQNTLDHFYKAIPKSSVFQPGDLISPKSSNIPNFISSTIQNYTHTN